MPGYKRQTQSVLQTQSAVTGRRQVVFHLNPRDSPLRFTAWFATIVESQAVDDNVSLANQVHANNQDQRRLNTTKDTKWRTYPYPQIHVILKERSDAAPAVE
ncbi:MAG: hypothetical protein CMJ72_09340 [Planctomycetaceae bacterium]|nr:hypothetical protein [Planctomycetaceae bacterium]